MKPVQMVCCRCGSADVWRDAYAAWDVETQEWVTAATYDAVYCHECDDTDARIEEVDLVTWKIANAAGVKLLTTVKKGESDG